MNSIEEESTFFITIEKKNIKNQINNFKNMKSKYFCRPIKSIKSKQNKNHKSSFSFSNNTITNNQKEFSTSLQNQIKIINNISKIHLMQNYRAKENKTNIFLYKNNNKNKSVNENLEENIDIEDDIDEFCNINCNININKPKLPFYNLNYCNNYNNSNCLSISRNILNNILNKTSHSNSKLTKMKNNGKKNNFNKNKSCTFINNDLLKLKLNQNIDIIKSKIDMLKTLIKNRNLQILTLQLFFEKNNLQHKIKKNERNFDKINEEKRKEIFNLKILKANCEEKYINKKKLEEEINKENYLFSSKKAEIIEKILDYKMIIIKKKIKYNYNYNDNSNNNIHNNEESTIINDSYIFDYEYNILDTKENLSIIEEKNKKLKNINIINDNEELRRTNKNEINSIKNKNVENYFIPRFLIETKSFNKNKSQHKYHPNSKFNILINYNNNGK